MRALLIILCSSLCIASCTSSSSTKKVEVQSSYHRYDFDFSVKNENGQYEIKISKPNTDSIRVIRVNEPIQYIDARPESGGFAVNKDGQVGMISWSPSSEPQIAKFHVPGMIKGLSMSRIIAWGSGVGLAVACDDKGRLLLTNPNVLMATTVDIPNFPLNLEKPEVKISMMEDGVGQQIFMTGLSNNEAWNWKAEFPGLVTDSLK